MQEGPLLMTQADRDRLVTLKKAKKKLITQREAAEELGLSVRHVKRHARHVEGMWYIFRQFRCRHDRPEA